MLPTLVLEPVLPLSGEKWWSRGDRRWDRQTAGGLTPPPHSLQHRVYNYRVEAAGGYFAVVTEMRQKMGQTDSRRTDPTTSQSAP
jgi:hypothetical protein